MPPWRGPRLRYHRAVRQHAAQCASAAIPSGDRGRRWLGDDRFCDFGGTPVTAHGELIRGWLKQQQNFDGLVISDWGSIADLTHFGIAQDALRAAELALQAGVDMAMTHEAYEDKLDQLVLQGRIKEALLDDAVRRVLRAKFRCGLFERPYVDEEWHKRELRRPEHLALAQRLAEQSIVLLKTGRRCCQSPEHPYR